MTLTEQIITIAMVVLGTVLTRFLPFLLFPAGKATPKYIQYLGKVLPPAVFGLLVVYCLKNVSIFTGSHGIPEFLSILAVVFLHLWKRRDAAVHCRRDNSIHGPGTACFLNLIKKRPHFFSKTLFCKSILFYHTNLGYSLYGTKFFKRLS